MPSFKALKSTLCTSKCLPSARRSPLTAHCSLLPARMLASSIFLSSNMLESQIILATRPSSTTADFGASKRIVGIKNNLWSTKRQRDDLILENMRSLVAQKEDFGSKSPKKSFPYNIMSPPGSFPSTQNNCILSTTPPNPYPSLYLPSLPKNSL